MSEIYNCIRPGETWLDTNGKRIQAHGGSMICVDGVFYWYGENKEKTFEITENSIWHWGIKCYSSTDMYNWKDEGIICKPTPKKDGVMNPIQCAERPHIIYNENTKKYVMWIKYMNRTVKENQKYCIATAENILGPYVFVNEVHPFGMNGGDFDIAKDSSNGKAYIYFERVHSELICAELNEDYTDVTGVYSMHFPLPGCPYVREAPAFFERNGNKYLLTSGTTGYFPNPTKTAIAKNFHGPWSDLGKTHLGDVRELSFCSQISCVFKHPDKKDLYIAMADRWLTDLGENITFSDIKPLAISYSDDSEDVVEAKKQKIKSLSKRNMSLADYVWLPIVFKNDIPYIEWKDKWRIEEYE